MKELMAMGSFSEELVFQTMARNPGDGENAPLEWFLEARNNKWDVLALLRQTVEEASVQMWIY